MSSVSKLLLWPAEMLVSLWRSLHSRAESEPLKDLFRLTLTSADGTSFPARELSGKVLLVVNTASRCGFTKQYHGLEKLHEGYHGRGLEVLAFPSGDFMGQEFATDSEVITFCRKQFQTSFRLFSKAPVTGSGKQPIFKVLTEAPGGRSRGEICWNFEKFLIDRSGRLVGRWRSWTAPDAPEIVKAIEVALER